MTRMLNRVLLCAALSFAAWWLVSVAAPRVRASHQKNCTVQLFGGPPQGQFLIQEARRDGAWLVGFVDAPQGQRVEIWIAGTMIVRGCSQD